MRIAIDARMLLTRPTGIGRYIFNLVKYLGVIDRVNEYIVLTNDRKLINIPGMHSNIHIEQVNSRPMTIAEQFALPLVLNRLKCDVFHAPSFVIPRMLPSKSVITLHDLTHIKFNGEFNKLVQLYYKCIVRPSTKKARLIIADSESSKKDIINWANIDASRVRVTSLAVENNYRLVNDKNVLKNVKIKYKIGKEYILYNGNKKPHKNVESLVKAFCRLRTEKKIDYSLVIVGERNDNEAETNYLGLEKIVNDYKLLNEVIYTGHVADDDLVLLYNAAAVFVFPSFYEGFGLPPLEAMSCGCPVVASNSSSLPEVCGDAAQYVDPYNIDDIVEGIYKVFSDDKLRKDLIRKGFLRAAAFSWEKCARETLSIYEEVFKS